MEQDQATKLREMMMLYTNKKPTSKVITVVSGKGGVGKSSTIINIATQLSQIGKKVIVLDAGRGVMSIESMLNINPKMYVEDLLFENIINKNILTRNAEDIDFIMYNLDTYEIRDIIKKKETRMVKNLNVIDDIADFVIIDTKANTSGEVVDIMLHSTDVILVTTPEATSLTCTYALLRELDKSGLSKNVTLNLLSNKVKNEDEGKMVFDKLSLLTDRFLKLNLKYMGTIMEDINIEEALLQRKSICSLYPNSDSSKEYERIAQTINANKGSYKYEQREGIKNLIVNLLSNKKNGGI